METEAKILTNDNGDVFITYDGGYNQGYVCMYVRSYNCSYVHGLNK